MCLRVCLRAPVCERVFCPHARQVSVAVLLDNFISASAMIDQETKITALQQASSAFARYGYNFWVRTDYICKTLRQCGRQDPHPPTHAHASRHPLKYPFFSPWFLRPPYHPGFGLPFHLETVHQRMIRSRRGSGSIAQLTRNLE
jgi:hypothetical protein